MEAPKEIAIHSISKELADNDFQGHVEGGRPSSSSWASVDDLRRARIRRNHARGTKTIRSTPPRARHVRTKTPTTNNRSAFSEYDSIDEEDLSSCLPPNIHDGPPKKARQSSSFRKWLAEGMLDTLNVVAGITLSTTGTILSPPIAMTKNVLLPGLLGILIDTLDAITPLRVQDWFRILSSSMYHLFSVLVSGKTEPGLQFRNQVGLVAGSFVEAWSAPEARQVLVDGMATGVKLADALHTPEMEVFLDQLGVLGCRLVDAMASGKTKEFIQNSKELIWRTIELASDPNTTIAIAEVTAHLCHALEEVDDSFGSATSRAVRDTQNRKTYLNSRTMTKDYPSRSLETIMLSSLGMLIEDDDGCCLPLVDEIDGDDETTTEQQSVPSNVAFQVEGGNVLGGLPTEAIKDDTSTRSGSHFEKCKNKVDLEFLQDTIRSEGRPQARIKRKDSAAISQTLSTNASLASPIPKDEVTAELDVEDTPFVTVPQRGTRTPRHPNLEELYRKFETMPPTNSQAPPYVQFYSAIDNLLAEKRKQKTKLQQTLENEFSAAPTVANPQAPPVGCGGAKAAVKTLRNGRTRHTKTAFRYAREEYGNLRRLWKYPPPMLLLGGSLAVLASSIWIGFGIYGMYTFFRPTSLPPRQPDPIDALIYPPSESIMLPNEILESKQDKMLSSEDEPNVCNPGKDDDSLVREDETLGRTDERPHKERSNEIVIRIIREIVHVREDLSRIESSDSPENDKAMEVDLTPEEIDIVSSILEERNIIQGSDGESNYF